MTTKIALVGIGKIARDQHVPSIAASPDWALAATVSRHGSVDGIAAYADLPAMLAARPDVGVVSLCMPPVPRFAYAKAALEAGRHVMLEKPPGATISECHTLMDLARDMGVALYATWHSRQAACVDAARAWLATRHLKTVHINWKEDVRRWHPGQEWVWQPGGIGVFDPGINALSILTEILPVPIHLTGATLDFPANRQTPIAARLDFYHPGGAAVTADFDWRQQGDQSWTITAETDDGSMALLDGGDRLVIGDAEINDNGAAAGEYARLYARMSELVALREIDMDLAPLRHVADAFMLGERRTVDRFDW